ncbi:MAG: GNAT family N-acetyltransferase [Nannocystaceae bacterium]
MPATREDDGRCCRPCYRRSRDRGPPGRSRRRARRGRARHRRARGVRARVRRGQRDRRGRARAAVVLRRSRRCVLVAHDHDGDRSALLGTCGVFLVAPRTYELRKMYLAAAARGRGVGTRLLEEAVAWTKARGGERMVLDTTEAMTAAIAFYERHGFVRDDGQIRGSRCTRGYVRRL